MRHVCVGGGHIAITYNTYSDGTVVGSLTKTVLCSPHRNETGKVGVYLLTPLDGKLVARLEEWVVLPSRSG